MYHVDFLDRHLSSTHKLRYNAFFTQQWGVRLREFVSCGLSSPELKATGVPAQVVLMKKIDTMHEEIGSLKAMLSGLPETVVSSLREALEDNAQLAGIVTPQLMMTRMDEMLQRCGLQQLIERMTSGTFVMQQPPADVPVSITEESRPLFPMYKWNGRPQLLPLNFRIPNVTLLNAYQLYHCGDATPGSGHLPLSKVSVSHFSNKSYGVRLAPLRNIMRHVDELVKSKSEEWRLALEKDHPPTLPFAQVNAMYAAVENDILPSKTLQGRPRRINEIVWLTAEKELRIERKRLKLANEEEGAEKEEAVDNAHMD